ncbi:MAG: hypothetical protein LBD76_00605 [Prevotellaceae bacterium]|jgi:hypothetical protein|nr:hypothetical protein [Prevotellaceae bacterium]
MKHITNIFLIIAVVSIAMFSACKDDDPKASDPSSLKVDQTEIDVLPVGGETLISINTDLSWNATSDVDWVKISPASGNGSGVVSVEIERHVGARRTATINVSAGSISQTVNILQRGQIPELYFLRLDMETAIPSLAMAGEGGSELIVVKSNMVDWSIWTIEANVDWIHVQDIIDLNSGDYLIIDESGNIYYEGFINTNVMATKAIVLSVDANANLAERLGEITFSYGNYFSDTLNVSQSGLRVYDDDGYLVVDKLPFRDKSNYELSAVKWPGQIGAWGEKFGVLAYKVVVNKSGKLKITDLVSPTYNIWFLLYDDKEAADKGEHKAISEVDGTIEYNVTPGTYYVFGIMNTWYGDIAPLTSIPYDIEITCE